MATVTELIKHLQTLPPESEIKLKSHVIFPKRNNKIEVVESELELKCTEIKPVYYITQFFKCLI
jgi:hypothetical protein